MKKAPFELELDNLGMSVSKAQGLQDEINLRIGLAMLHMKTRSQANQLAGTLAGLPLTHGALQVIQAMSNALPENPVVTPLPIGAEVHTDDHDIEINFDASPWFAQASDSEIVELANCGWGGDLPADAVAQESVKWYPEIEAILDHKGPHKDLSGFECHVDESDAIAWLEANRPRMVKHGAVVG
jgi:hypothetical protein